MASENDDPVLGGTLGDTGQYEDMDIEDILGGTQNLHSNKELELPHMNFDPNVPLTHLDITQLFVAGNGIDDFQSQIQSDIDSTVGKTPTARSQSQGPSPTQRSHESASPCNSTILDSAETIDVEELPTQIDGSTPAQQNILTNVGDNLVMVDKESSPVVKKEATDDEVQFIGHVIKYAGKEIIEISDSDDDQEEHMEPHGSTSTTPRAQEQASGARTNGLTNQTNAGGIKLGARTMLRTPNPKGKRTPGQYAKLLEAQKRLVEQATGKSVTGGAYSILKSLQEASGQPAVGSSGDISNVIGENRAQKPSESGRQANNDRQGSRADTNAEALNVEEDEHAWMMNEVSDSDIDAAAM